MGVSASLNRLRISDMLSNYVKTVWHTLCNFIEDKKLDGMISRREEGDE